MAFILQKTNSDLQAIKTSETLRHKVWILTSVSVERWVHPGLCLAAQAWHCNVFDYLSGAVAHIQFDVEHMLCTQWANWCIKTSKTTSQQMVQKDKPICMLTNNNQCGPNSHNTASGRWKENMSYLSLLGCMWCHSLMVWCSTSANRIHLTHTHIHSKCYNSEQKSPDVSVCLWVIYPEDGTTRVISHMPSSLFNYCLTLQEGSSGERFICFAVFRPDKPCA